MLVDAKYGGSKNIDSLVEGVAYKDPSSSIEEGDTVTVFMGAAPIYRGQVCVVEGKLSTRS